MQKWNRALFVSKQQMKALVSSYGKSGRVTDGGWRPEPRGRKQVKGLGASTKPERGLFTDERI